MPTGGINDRLVFLLQWLPTVTISATIIAFVTASMNRRLASLKEGKSPIIESGHTVILGWSNRLFPVLQQLAIAQATQRRPLVVVVSDKDVASMMTEIDSRCGDLGKLRVVCRSGDVTNPEILKRANLTAARSTLVLESESSSDAVIISTVLAIKSIDPQFSVPLVVEVNDPQHGVALRHATNHKVRTVTPSSIIARVTAQASRQPGLATVLVDLLDFEGDEIQIKRFPELAGRSYLEVLTSFDQGKVIGVAHAGDDVKLNPAPSTIIGADDSLIIVAEDDDVAFTGLATVEPSLQPASVTAFKDVPEDLLIVGWSTMGANVLDELVPFLAAGSTVTVIADPALVTQRPPTAIGSTPLTFIEARGVAGELETIFRERNFAQVLVLAYRTGISAEEADARTMLTLLLLTELGLDAGGSRTRLVAEILDSRRAGLAKVANPDDLVVSDNLSALMMAQLSEDVRLVPVFADLFDVEGAALHVKPVDLYVTPGTTVTVRQLVALGGQRGESVIGYRHADGRVVVNPDATTTLTPAAGDGVVVLAG